MAYKSKFNGTQIDTLLEKTQELSDLHEAGELGGGSSWQLAGFSTSLSTDGTTDITGLTDENTEYLCRMRANVGYVWDYTITLVRGSGVSNIRNGTQVWLNMSSIKWMNVDALIDEVGTAKVQLYSGTTDITASLARNITEIAIYKRPLMQ
jgi:hypothetical protein